MDKSTIDTGRHDHDRAASQASDGRRDDGSNHDSQEGRGMIGATTEMARSAAASTAAGAQDLARRAREQTGAATEAMSRGVHHYPAAALLIAGAVGYGLAYLIHNSGWQLPGWDDAGRRRDDRHERHARHDDHERHARHDDHDRAGRH